MVDKPVADGKKEYPKKKESGAANVTVAALTSGSPTPTSQAQTAKANKERKYAKYVMPTLVASWRGIRKGFAFLDKHNGTVGALAAVAIAVLTCFYVHYSRKQWQTMTAALHVSERAYISLGFSQLDLTKMIATLQLSNSGRIPSGAVEAIVHEATVDVPVPDSPVLFNRAIEYHWKRHRVSSVPPGFNALNMAIHLPAASQVKLESAVQAVVISVRVTYNDGFPDDPPQPWAFCIQSVYHHVAKQIFWAPCDPALVIPQMEALDGYPNNEERN